MVNYSASLTSLLVMKIYKMKKYASTSECCVLSKLYVLVGH
jgi:hypothetical protein